MLDEIEQGFFWGRNYGGVFFAQGGKWICASGERDHALARAWIMEPSGKQGWTVVVDSVAEDEEYCRQPMVVGVNKNLSYAEAEKIAYGYITEGEVEFDFHRDVALRIWGGIEHGWIDASISVRFDMHRSVRIYKAEGGWRAFGSFEIWNPDIRCFEAERPGPSFPASGVGEFEAVRQAAYDWAVQPALEEISNQQAAA
ncbi:hypothetical protein [Rhizobium leguminosarum]|uniref:hypothetical protein n=1 Tax=Rhizobium leguminosarum TaxID=384 RepID=UPI001C93BCD7|nr:hypothetical protein [Rhizobium leguminosarum]MBY5809637.1 hypothetical protein [Rhizobium leguminosarum]